MFVGHLALALAAKRAVPKAPLGWLMAAVTALDLLWPLFLLAGIEHVRVSRGATAFNPLIFDSYPWSHGLLLTLLWGTLLAVLGRSRGLSPRIVHADGCEGACRRRGRYGLAIQESAPAGDRAVGLHAARGITTRAD